MNRKSFLNLTARAGLFLGVTPSLIACANDEKSEKEILEELLKTEKVLGNAVNLTTEAISKVRVGIIGMGNRGSVLIQMFEYLIKNNHAEIVALSDLREEKLQKNQDYLKTIQDKEATLYFKDKDDWKNLAKRDDIDLILIATPWEYHTEMSVFGMENGKHVSCEQPMAMTLKDFGSSLKLQNVQRGIVCIWKTAVLMVKNYGF